MAQKSGESKVIALSLRNLGLVAADQGDYSTSLSYFEESLQISDAINDRQNVGVSLNNMGSVVVTAVTILSNGCRYFGSFDPFCFMIYLLISAAT